jgi:prevent-host-death family protein
MHECRTRPHAPGLRAVDAGNLTTGNYGYKILVTMSTRKPTTRGPRSRDHVAAADFKARCLELMDRVRETGEEYVVTKHGAPVARLVPYRTLERPSLFGSMKGTVLKYERPLDPLDDEYEINRG